MKVLHVINIGGFGGAEKLLLQLLPELNRRERTDCLICCKIGDNISALKIGDELKEKGVFADCFFYKTIIDKKLFQKITEVINAGNYDLVHSHLSYANLWLSYLKWRKKIRLPVITTLHGYRDSYQNKHGLLFKRSEAFSFYYRLTGFIFRKLDGFILISKCLKEFFEQSRLLKGKSTKVIYHGYQALAGDPTLFLRLGPLMDPKIAIPGRLIRMKGHLFAIRVLKEMLSKRPLATLHIYGKGPEEAAIRQSVKEYGLENNIFFHGYVHDLLDQLKECDIALIPSIYESFGLVFLDAFAAGVPVVAFDLPAGNEIITDQADGLLAKPYDHQSLFEQVVKLCDSEDMRRFLVSNAKTKLQTTFSIERMVDEYTQYYSYFCKAD